MRAIVLAAAALAIALIQPSGDAVAQTASTPAADSLVVIVHPSRTGELSRSVLRQIFLKQRRFWSDAEKITPVNQPAGSDTREAFSRTLYDRPSRGHLAYWNRAYFHGLLPPITLDSDRAVVLFVAQRPNAIGYVRASVVDDSVAVATRLPAAAASK